MRRRSLPACSLVAIALTAAAVCLQAAADTVPRLSLWYQGEPPGVASAADLASIRAAGFTAITWPAAQGAGTAEAARLAAAAGLELIVRSTPAALTPAAARQPGPSVDIVTAGVPSAAVAPLVWRAIAHGARDVSFDPGMTGAHALSGPGTALEWPAVVGDISRQLRINGKLLAQAATAPERPRIDGPAAEAIDVVLLSAGRTWVLVATNTGRSRAHVTAHLSPDVPYAIWLNLLNGGTLAMLSEPPGPRWSFELEAWGTRIYVIDKVLR